MKTLAEQERQAESAYREAHRRHPRSARTTRLWFDWRDAKAKLIALQTKRMVHADTERAETPLRHQRDEIAA